MEVKSGKMTALKNSSQRLRFGHIFFSPYAHMEGKSLQICFGADKVEQRVFVLEDCGVMMCFESRC